MKFALILGLLTILVGCSGNKQKTESNMPVEGPINQSEVLSFVPKIENRINYGARYTDSDSSEYWLIHIASTITNDNTIPIQLQMAFSKEYTYPIEYGDQKYNVFLLPKVFTIEGTTIVTEQAIYTDSMQVEIRNYIASDIDTPYILNKTLEPGKKYIVPIGTRFPVSSKCGIIPNMILLQSQIANFQECEHNLAQDKSINSQILLGLKLDFNRGESNESCTIIPCGQISYLER